MVLKLVFSAAGANAAPNPYLKSVTVMFDTIVHIS